MGLQRPRFTLYSWSKFGREAEYIVALYLKSIGWDVRLSPASRGPADIVANCDSSKWFIQVKASSGIPRLKGYAVKRLMELAKSKSGLPVVSTFQPFCGGFITDNYSLFFFVLFNWQAIKPTQIYVRRGNNAWRPPARVPPLGHLTSRS